MQALAVAGYALAAATSGIALWHLIRRPWLLLKPSIVVLLLYHVLVQWPSALQSEWIWSQLPYPWDALILIHGFILGGLIVSLRLHGRVSEELWRRPSLGDQGISWVAIVSLVAPIFLAVALYLTFVPLPSTGLAAMRCEPSAAGAATPAPPPAAVGSQAPATPDPSLQAAVNRARETSLKGTSSLVAYAYFFNAKGLSLVLTSVLTLWWLRQRRRLVWAGPYLVSVAALALGASLSGGRAFGLYIILAAAVTAFVDRRHEIWRRPVWMLAAVAAVVLAPVWPAILTILRECQQVTAGRILDYSASVLTDRLLVGLVPAATYYLQYAQTNGLLALTALPAVSKLIGTPSVNLPNLIQITYYSTSPSTGLANSGFPFVYYVYLGLAAVPVSVALVQLPDLLLYVAARLRAPLSTTFAAALIVNSAVLIESEFTTALVTHGILPASAIVIAVAFLDSRWGTWRASTQRRLPDGAPSGP